MALPLDLASDATVDGVDLTGDPPVLLAGRLRIPFDQVREVHSAGTSNFQHDVRVFDSLGKAHDVTVFFTRTGDNTWALNIGADDGDFTGGTKGNLHLLSSGMLAFNPDASVASVSGNVVSATFATIESGVAAIATAGVAGNGAIVSSALEQSNVQLAQEFNALISTQRTFQANTRVITASDTLLGDLVNIIR